MKIAIWEHPARPGVKRAYINNLPFVPKGEKVFLQPRGKGVQLVAPDVGIHEEISETLRSYGLLTEDQSIEQIPFEALENWAQANPVKAGRPAGKATRGSAANLAKRAPARTQAGTRHQEADNLDLTTIPVPDPVTIRIDYREPDELFELLDGLSNVTVERRELALGDIEIQGQNTQYVIERKCCTNGESRTDFEASVVDDTKRLFFQSEKMRLAEGVVPIILLEGCAHEHSRGMLVQAIDGMLSYLITIQRLSVLTTYSLKHTAYFLLKLAAHDRSGLGYEPPLRAKKPRAQADQLTFVLEGLPGVSANLARRLADQFGSLAGLVAASDSDLLAVPGMGPKRIEQIKRVIHGDA